MKVETPQILWHNGSEGNGKPAPLYSLSLLPCPSNSSSSSHNTSNSTSNGNNDNVSILATSGNTNEVHVWKLTFPDATPLQSQTETEEEPAAKRPRILSASKADVASPSASSASSSSSTSISHIATLSRHQRSVNTLAFSPRGTHLATAGDTGSFIIFTIPAPYRRSTRRTTTTTTTTSTNPNIINTQIMQANPNNAAFFWKTQFTSEKDLNVKVINTHSEDIMDLNWSNDEKRVILGSLDHSVCVFEETYHHQYTHGHGPQSAATESPTNGLNAKSALALTSASGGVNVNVNSAAPISASSQSEWNCVWRNSKEHTHYVQGVAYDPLGVYIASQGSDRTVRVWQRKRGNVVTKNSSSSGVSSSISGSNNSSGGGASKNKVLCAMDNNVRKEEESSSGDVNVTGLNSNGVNVNSAVAQAVSTSTHLNNGQPTGKFDVGKAKVLKYRHHSNPSDKADTGTTNANASHDIQMDENNSNANTNANANANSTTTNPSIVKKRHLFADESTVESFFRRLTWTSDGAFLITPASLWHPDENETNAAESATTSATSSSLTTTTSSSPSFATYLFARHQYDRPYKVLSGLEKPSLVVRTNPILFKLPKHAQSDSKENLNKKGTIQNLPYRSIFAVLTTDSILIYDTYHTRPLCIARGLHYAGLTDCSWSSDGKNLVVCSTDGYVSILSFGEDELGEVYLDHLMKHPVGLNHSALNSTSVDAAAFAAAATASNATIADGTVTTNAASNVNLNNALGETCANQGGGSGQTRKSLSSTSPASVLPPCQPGQSSTLVAPPAKKARMMIDQSSSSPMDCCSQFVSMGQSKNRTSARKDDKNEKKKRIVPTLMTQGFSDEQQQQQQQQQMNNKGALSENTNKANVEKSRKESAFGDDVGKCPTSVETEVVGGVTNLSINNDLQRKMNEAQSTCC